MTRLEQALNAAMERYAILPADIRGSVTGMEFRDDSGRAPMAFIQVADGALLHQLGHARPSRWFVGKREVRVVLRDDDGARVEIAGWERRTWGAA